MQPHFTDTCLITDDVPGLAACYAALLDAEVQGGAPHARVPGDRRGRTSRTPAARGIEILKPPTTQPRGRRSVWLRDPEGNIVNLYQQA
ncbi:VOC family protein [Streptomyces griseus]|uniref:VOC family protein n=1 Tax=Streptomyces griseus TaxID=1911 RepID=UPI000567DF0E|nr:glyoxalase/bleomycin resistance/dioxygenase family protein [Streptomyces griseus]